VAPQPGYYCYLGKKNFIQGCFPYVAKSTLLTKQQVFVRIQPITSNFFQHFSAHRQGWVYSIFIFFRKSAGLPKPKRGSPKAKLGFAQAFSLKNRITKSRSKDQGDFGSVPFA